MSEFQQQPAYPQSSEDICLGDEGFTKLERAAVDVYCALLTQPNMMEELKVGPEGIIDPEAFAVTAAHCLLKRCKEIQL